MTDRITCSRCRMSFRVEEQKRAERLRCPDCKRPFWQYVKRPPGNVVRVGIRPDWQKEWHDGTSD